MDTPESKNKTNDSMPQDALEKCSVERDEYLNGWKRAKADLINYQKDEAKRFEEVIKFGYKAIVKDLLDVLDSLDLATSVPQADKGIVAIKNQLLELLRKYGVAKMEVAVGDKFDAKLHEAVAEVESDKPPGTIAEVLASGYRLHDQTIRPARVKISKEKGQ